MNNREIIIGGVSDKEKLLLVKQLYAAMKAGYNSSQALEIAVTQSKGRLKAILNQVIDEVADGAYLYESFLRHEKYFSPLFINLIKTGELSASLKENLKRLNEILEREYVFRQKVRSAMVYPAFLFLAVVSLGLGIAFFILPSILPLFKSLDVELPLSTRLLIWIAEAFDQYAFTIAMGIFISFVVLIWIIRQKFSQPVTHWFLLHFPLVGKLHRQLIMARFGRSIASLLRSGIPIDETLQITTTTMTNYYYKSVITSVIPNIKRGQALADALSAHQKYFEDIFIKLLDLGEKTAGLEEASDNLAEYFEAEVDETMKNLAVSLEPMLIIIVGGIVAFVAFSILGPIYKITGNIR